MKILLNRERKKGKTKRIEYHHSLISVVIQPYEAEADNEYVIRGNSAIMKCEIPSYVSDFIVVDMWTDSDGGSYYPNNDQYGILRYYTHTIDSSIQFIYRRTYHFVVNGFHFRFHKYFQFQAMIIVPWQNKQKKNKYIFNPIILSLVLTSIFWQLQLVIEQKKRRTKLSN